MLIEFLALLFAGLCLPTPKFLPFSMLRLASPIAHGKLGNFYDLAASFLIDPIPRPQYLVPDFFLTSTALFVILLPCQSKFLSIISVDRSGNLNKLRDEIIESRPDNQQLTWPSKKNDIN